MEFSSDKPMRLAILVLGDLARSTRMLNHAREALKAGMQVTLIGHQDTELPEDFLQTPMLSIRSLAAWRPAGRQQWSRWRYLAYLPLRMFSDTLALLWALWRVPADALLVQTPPAVPALLLARLTTRLRGQRLIFDWHNLGYRITGLQFGQGHRLTRFSAWLERVTGNSRRANHLAVTQALADFLLHRWRLPAAQVLRDAPPVALAEPPDRAALYRSLPELENVANHPGPVLLCPSSWTMDDDLDLALEVLPDLDAQLRSSKQQLLMIFSGIGPRRDQFAKALATLKLEAVTVKLAWVPLRDYPALLASADIGLSLHRSASGLDLPIKVYELYGAGVARILALSAGGPFAEIRLPGLRCFNDASALLAELQLLRPVSQANAHVPDAFDEWQRLVKPLLYKDMRSRNSG